MKIEPARSAIILIHMQHDVMADDGAFGVVFAAEVKRTGLLRRAAALSKAARSRGVLLVYVGVSANITVEGTARDATYRRLRTYVVEDCCAAAEAAAHEASIATMRLLTNGVLESSEVVAALAV